MNGSSLVHQELWQPIARREAIWLSPFLLGYIAFGLLSARLGFAANPDSPAIWRSAGIILQGGYQPSRTSGFPAYEGFVALLRGLGADAVTVAVATLALGVVAFALALRCAPGPAARLAVAVLFCASPVVVTNASSVMETNLTLMTVAAFLCLHLRLSASPGDPAWRLAAMAMLAGWAVVLSRIDAAIIVTASLVALFLVRRRPIYLAVLAGTGTSPTGSCAGISDSSASSATPTTRPGAASPRPGPAWWPCCGRPAAPRRQCWSSTGGGSRPSCPCS